MSQDNMIKMACTVCGRVTHNTTKNKKIKGRLETNMHCKFCKATNSHKETK